MIWLLAAPAWLAAPAAAQPAAQAEVPAPDFFAAEPSLREYVALALEANPGLAEACARYRAALEKVPQVTALPDPMVGFGQMLRSAETRVGPQLNTFGAGGVITLVVVVLLVYPAIYFIWKGWYLPAVSSGPPVPETAQS